MRRQRRTALVALVVAVALLVPLTATAASGTWSELLPTSGDVVVPAGTEVVLDTDVDLEGLRIDGTVRCGSQKVEIRARWILVNGRFECGTADEPYRRRLTIVLTGPGTGNFNGYGDKYLVVAAGGELLLHGKSRRTWTTLAEPARPGDTKIVLAKPLGTVGDWIALAPTNYRLEQAEAARIAVKDGAVLTLEAPLGEEHWCGEDAYAGRTLVECAEVGLLTHKIQIKGDPGSDTAGLGGHAMFLEGSTVHIEGVLFRRMGQQGALGRYPVHWHMAANSEGSIVRSAVWESYNRFVTIHGTHGIEVRRVVGFETLGHGFYLEDGGETGNQILCNLAIAVRGAPDPVTPSDIDAAGFWISNPDNVVEGNRAAGADFAGFWLGFPEHPRGLSSTNAVWPRRTPLLSFRRNQAHTVGFAGLYVDGGEAQNRSVVTTWYEPREDPSDPDSDQVVPEIRGFTAWKSQHYGAWIRTFAGVEMSNARFADNWRSLYLANIPSGPDNGNVGVVTDSLFVGTSSNHGTPESWERVDVNGHMVPQHWDTDAPLGGIAFYDGPMRVADSVFADFTSNATRDAGALSALFPNPFSISVRNEAEAITFVRSKRVLFPDIGGGRLGDNGTMFIDLDGSVTGTAGAVVTVRQSLLDDGDCTTKGAWNAATCPGSYARMFITREDGGDLDADVVRDDGRSVFLASEQGWQSTIALNGRAGRAYTVDPSGSNPSGWSFWGDEIPAGGAIVIAVPAPTGSWTVEIWGPNRGSVASRAALDSGTAGWFYDSATGLLYLRFTSAARGGIAE